MATPTLSAIGVGAAHPAKPSTHTHPHTHHTHQPHSTTSHAAGSASRGASQPCRCLLTNDHHAVGCGVVTTAGGSQPHVATWHATRVRLAHHSINVPVAGGWGHAALRVSSDTHQHQHPPCGVRRSALFESSSHGGRGSVAARSLSTPRPAPKSFDEDAASEERGGERGRSGYDASEESESDADASYLADSFYDARVPSWVTLTRARWDAVTARLASSATVPFLFLTMPQIAKNAQCIAAGRPEALAAIAWQGQIAGLLGNLLLLSYFADKGERSASVVQGVGVCTTGALLCQIALAGHIPIAHFVAAATVVGVGVVLSVMRVLGRVGPVDVDGQPCDKVAAAACEDNVPCVGNVQCDVSAMYDDDEEGDSDSDSKPATGDDVGGVTWEAYQGLLGVLGLAALPQVGFMSLLPAAASARLGMWPGAAGATLGLVLVVVGRAGALPPALATAWGRLSGWTATLLFMTMPVAQLASNFANPASLEGLSVLSSVLAMTGNALMVPRALFTRDVIWLTGSTWGSGLMGWGVMLSLFLGRSAETGARYMSSPSFVLLTAVYFGYLVVVLAMDGLASVASGRSVGWRLAAWRYGGLSLKRADTKTKAA